MPAGSLRSQAYNSIISRYKINSKPKNPPIYAELEGVKCGTK
jgi:hypothetical protein